MCISCSVIWQSIFFSFVVNFSKTLNYALNLLDVIIVVYYMALSHKDWELPNSGI